MHREFGEKKLLLSTGLRLGEQICKLALRRNKVRDKSTLKVLVTEEEGINTYVLGERVLGWIQGNLNGRMLSQ